ncbi:MAG: hypothetical protein AXW16_04450 [Cycloclasticus sp. Phe_18]|nr:MAG: hypothetical protein AXW16_04450 [Cycloclasticus sp. Phe_18]
MIVIIFFINACSVWKNFTDQAFYFASLESIGSKGGAFFSLLSSAATIDEASVRAQKKIIRMQSKKCFFVIIIRMHLYI